MAYEQDIIQLPVRFFDYTDLEGMAVAINRNFNEVERYLSILQGYVKQASGGAVSNLPSVLSGLAPNGIFDVSKLSDKMVGLEHELQIAAEAVTEAKIAVEAITSNKIATDAVTEQKIAASAVTALKIANGSLELAKFATGLRPVQIVNSLPTLPDPNYPQGATVFLTTNNVLYRSTGAAWTSIVDNVAPGAIGSDQLAANSVIAGKIAAGAVSADELAANSVVAGKVAANAIGADAIAAGAVTTDKLAALSVIAAKIAAGAITTEKILADAVTADKINVSQLSAISADMGTVNAGIINADVVIAGQYATTDADMLSRIPGLYYVTSTELLGSQIAAFKRNTVAYRQNGLQVAADIPRYEAGKYGQAVVVEESCANIIATWPTGWTVGGDAGMSATDKGILPGAALNTVRLTNSGTTEGYYSSPLFALSPSTTYTVRIKARGTVGAGKFDTYVLSNTGTFVQKEWTNIPLTGAFQVFSTTFTTTSNITGTNQYIRFDHNGNDAGYVEIAEVTLIQKAYPLSFPGYGTTRAAEVLSMPTAGIFTKGNWTIELVFRPTSKQDIAGRYAYLFNCYIDGNNYYAIIVHETGRVYAECKSGGYFYNTYTTAAPVLSVGSDYYITVSGNGSKLRHFQNGVQISTDVTYTEPVGTLPANMYVGCSSAGSSQTNGLIDDFRVSNRARTLAEHQEVYNGGKPLEVDKDTTLLMPLDNTLRQKARNRLLHEVGTFTIASADTTNNPSRATHIVPAGWTSAQTTINQAISELPTNGGKIVLMEGTYIIDGSIVLPSNTTLEISAGATVKLKNNCYADVSMITNSDHTNGNTNIKVVGEGVIDGNKAQQYGYMQHGVYFERVSNSTVKGLTVINAYFRGIQLEYSSKNNIIMGNTCQGNGHNGIHLDYLSNDNTVTGNTCQGNGNVGIYLVSSNNTVTGNTCNGNSYYGVHLNSASNNSVTGNTCQGNGYVGIYIYSSLNNTVAGNTCQENGGKGIELLACSKGNTVTGNTCQGNGQEGIMLYYSANNAIVGNACIENSRTANNYFDNIYLYSDCDYNNIQNNICRVGSAANKPRYGINIASSNCDGNLVTNNDLITSGVSGSFNNAGTNTQVNAGNRL